MSVFVYPALFLQREEMRLTHNPLCWFVFSFSHQKISLLHFFFFLGEGGGGRIPLLRFSPQEMSRFLQ